MADQPKVAEWRPPGLRSATWSLEWAEWDKNTPSQAPKIFLLLLLNRCSTKQQQQILNPKSTSQSRGANNPSPLSRKSLFQKHQRSRTERQAEDKGKRQVSEVSEPNRVLKPEKQNQIYDSGSWGRSENSQGSKTGRITGHRLERWFWKRAASVGGAAYIGVGVK